MFRSCCVISVLLGLCGMSVAQEITEAPVTWETYNIREHKISVQMPKMPIRYKTSYACDEKQTEHFVSYAEEKVYTLRVVFKDRVLVGKNSQVISMCQSTQKFDKNALNSRRDELAQNASRQDVGGIEVWEVSEPGKRPEKTWIFDDLRSNRWIELSITGRGDFSRESDYVASLEKSLSENGTEVGLGSPRVLGDAGVDATPFVPFRELNKDRGKKNETVLDYKSSLVIVSKVKAQYTAKARNKNEQGTVTLRVAFLANGGIGDIKVEKALDYGLTEEAIAAAKKIVFLPVKIDGKAVTTTRPVSYTFNIY